MASVHGPMGRSIADIRLFAEHVANAKPWLRDPKCVPDLAWRAVRIPERPKIAVLWDNGMVRPTPPVKRALRETVESLRGKGYDIVDWPATDHEEAVELLGKFFLADGGKSVENILKPVDEPWRAEMKGYEDATEMGVHELWQLQAQRTALCKRYLDRWEAVGGLDAILGPTTPYATTKNGEFRHVGYTGVFNILDYSSTSFPSGVYVDKSKDVVEEDIRTYNELDAQTQEEYDAELAHGLPVSLQLTGRRLEEEKILALTERVVEDLRS